LLGLLQSLYGLFLTICDPNACFFVDETFNRLALGSPGYRFLSCLVGFLSAFNYFVYLLVYYFVCCVMI